MHRGQEIQIYFLCNNNYHKISVTLLGLRTLHGHKLINYAHKDITCLSFDISGFINFTIWLTNQFSELLDSWVGWEDRKEVKRQLRPNVFLLPLCDSAGRHAGESLRHSVFWGKGIGEEQPSFSQPLLPTMVTMTPRP